MLSFSWQIYGNGLGNVVLSLDTAVHKKIMVRSIFACFMSFFFFQAEANDVLVLNTGVYSSKPYAWVDEKGVFHGAAVNKVDAVVRGVNKGYEIHYQMANSTRMRQELLKGRYDLLLAFPHPELESNAVRVGVVSDINVELWTLKDSLIRDNGRRDTFTIGTTSAHIDLLPKDQKTLRVNNSKTLIQMLIARRVDAVIATEPSLCYHSRVQGMSLSDFDRQVLKQRQTYLWVPKGGYIEKERAVWERSLKEFRRSALAAQMSNYCQWVLDNFDYGN